MKLQLLIIFGILFCFFENYSTTVLQRKKRETENIFYGNQQGSPHLSIKKTGKFPVGEDSSESQLFNVKKRTDEIDFVQSKKKRKLLKRAKRSLVKKSMENQMGSSVFLKRKKRSLDDELDDETLAQLQNILASKYDSYYDINPANYNEADDQDDYSTEYEIVGPGRPREFIPELNQYEALPRYDVPEEQVVVKKSFPEAEDEGPIEYEIAEVDGVPGMFFPFPPGVVREREVDISNVKRPMKRSGPFDDDYDEQVSSSINYNSKLNKLAAMLADNQK